MLLLSLLLGLLSLAGVAWIILVGSLLSVDGLFMSLILLTIAGVFFLNVLLECRDHGLLGKNGDSHTNVRNSESRSRREFCGPTRALSPSHVHAQSLALLRHRMADCA